MCWSTPTGGTPRGTTTPRASCEPLAQGRAPWAVPWPCIHEFLAVSTHPRIYRSASRLPQALDQLNAWLESPSLTLLGEERGYLERLEAVLGASRVVGPRVHDARIAALCLHHGVRELWSADRDFTRFPALTVRNPFPAA